MSYDIETEDQCHTPERTGIHTMKKDLDHSIDYIALEKKIAPSVVEDVLKGPLRRPDNPKYPSQNVSKDPRLAQLDFEVSFPPKAPIKCLWSAKCIGDLYMNRPSLVFTHGCGGTMRSEAMANFTSGFISITARPTLLCFQGNINLTSRVKMFSSVIENKDNSLQMGIKMNPTCLGGRSMGARAAIMASNEATTQLVLASYPLQSDRQIRDKILLDLEPSKKIIFVSGDRDTMCDLDKLREVRHNMKCKSWLIVVRNADHGMNVKPKAATEEVGKMAGALVATWLKDANERLTEGTISWDAENKAAQWSGWQPKPKATIRNRASAKPSKETVVAAKKSSEVKRDLDDEAHTDDSGPGKPRKRRKTQKTSI